MRVARLLFEIFHVAGPIKKISELYDDFFITLTIFIIIFVWSFYVSKIIKINLLIFYCEIIFFVKLYFFFCEFYCLFNKFMYNL